MVKKIVLPIALGVYLVALFIGATILKLNSFLWSGSDKFLHFASFFVLSLLLIFTLKDYNIKNALPKSLIIAAVIALLIEIIQLFFPGRSFSLLDIAAGLGGAILGVILAWILSKR